MILRKLNYEMEFGGDILFLEELLEWFLGHVQLPLIEQRFVWLYCGLSFHLISSIHFIDPLVNSSMIK